MKQGRGVRDEGEGSTNERVAIVRQKMLYSVIRISRRAIFAPSPLIPSP
jgi:hypothetical protein